jgi:hypothetical protein
MFENNHLNVLKWNIERERLIVVGIEGAFFDRGLFLPDSPTILHQGNFNVGI